jgi:hypothetical protein
MKKIFKKNVIFFAKARKFNCFHRSKRGKRARRFAVSAVKMREMIDEEN